LLNPFGYRRGSFFGGSDKAAPAPSGGGPAAPVDLSHGVRGLFAPGPQPSRKQSNLQTIKEDSPKVCNEAGRDPEDLPSPPWPPQQTTQAQSADDGRRKLWGWGAKKTAPPPQQPPPPQLEPSSSSEGPPLTWAEQQARKSRKAPSITVSRNSMWEKYEERERMPPPSTFRRPPPSPTMRRPLGTSLDALPTKPKAKDRRPSLESVPESLFEDDDSSMASGVSSGAKKGATKPQGRSGRAAHSAAASTAAPSNAAVSRPRAQEPAFGARASARQPASVPPYDPRSPGTGNRKKSFYEPMPVNPKRAKSKSPSRVTGRSRKGSWYPKPSGEESDYESEFSDLDA